MIYSKNPNKEPESIIGICDRCKSEHKLHKFVWLNPKIFYLCPLCIREWTIMFRKINKSVKREDFYNFIKTPKRFVFR